MFSFGRKRGRQTQARMRAASTLDPRARSLGKARRTPAVKNPPAPGLVLSRGIFKRALGMAAFMAFSGALLLASYFALALGPMFKVREVEVSGANYVSRLELLQAAGIGSDTSLLSLSTAKAAEGVRELPWVRMARVERLLPHGVRIAIEERQPAWLAVAEGGLFYLDATMRPFAPARADHEGDLPVVSGLTRADLVKPDEETLELLDVAQRLHAGLPAATVASLGGLSEIHLDRVWGLSVVFNNLPATVRLGLTGFETRWGRLDKVVEDLRARGELMRATLIDLDNDRRAVVRLGRESA
jgi:cell division septal protein FtsQ